LKAPNSKFIDGRPDPFRSVPTALIDIAKTDRSRRFVPVDVGAWSRVPDHFGDHFVR